MINPVKHLCQLKTNDRFYMLKDKTKQVWLVRFHEMRWRRGVLKKYTMCRNDKNECQYFDANRQVIFLRKEFIKKGQLKQQAPQLF